MRSVLTLQQLLLLSDHHNMTVNRALRNYEAGLREMQEC